MTNCALTRMQGGFAKTLAWLASAALAAGASGCSVEEVPRTQHEIGAPTSVAAPSVPAARANLEAIYAKYQPAIQKAVATAMAAQATPSDASGSASASELKARIEDVGVHFILNPSYVRDPERSKEPRFRQLLSFFNDAVLALAKIDLTGLGGAAGNERRGASYRFLCPRGARWMRREPWGCNPTAVEFSADPRTSKILMIKARQVDARMDGLAEPANRQARLDLAPQYYALLQLASDYANGIHDPDWQLAYMRRARDYALYLKSSPASFSNRVLLQRHGRIFERLIRDFQPDPKNPEFLKFVATFRPWSRSRLEADPFPWGTDRMFAFAADYLLYAKPGEGAGACGLSESLREALSQSQQNSDLSGPSFAEQVRALRSDSGPGAVDLLKGLRVDEAKRLADPCYFDEYFFMVDRLYRGHLNVEEVDQIWAGSKKDQKRIVEVANFYMKIQVLRMVLDTNRYMRGFYDKQQFNSENLVKQVILQSKDLSDKWGSMLDRFERISRFLGEQASSGRDGRQAFEDSMAIRDSIKRNIKYLAVYPNMMMLAYFMSDTNAKLEVQAWFWTVKFSADTVIEALLSGSLSPWFSFGTDDVKLNKSEIIYSFYYALAAGAFETFSVAHDAEGKPAVTRKRFFQQVMKKYLSGPVVALETSLVALRDENQGGDINVMRSACEFLRRGDLNFSITIDREAAPDFQFGGNGVSGPTRAAQKVYGNVDGLNEIAAKSARGWRSCVRWPRC